MTDPRSQIYPEERVEVLRNFGPQPISSRFTRQPGDDTFRQNLRLALCRKSGLVQLAETFPPEELRPRVPWITAFEPEGHLDDLADVIASLPGLTSDSVVAGYSSKDDTTLRRLSERGFTNQWRLDPATDLGILDPCAFVETFQLQFIAGTAAGAADLRGQPKLFFVRHVLEHSYDLAGFLRAAGDVVTADGYVVFEVPDCTRALDSLDYTTLWEEHSVYFTPLTFREALQAANLEPIFSNVYPHPFENCMVAVCQKREVGRKEIPEADLAAECERARRFAAKFPGLTSALREGLQKMRESGSRMALFGAGHLAVAFLSLHNLGDFFEFVVDDNPHKSDLFLPGSDLPIRKSASLIDERVDICLLSLNPESEEKVISKNQSFLAAGGKFLSIFPASDRYFGA